MKSRIKALVPGEDSSWFTDVPFLAVSSHGRERNSGLFSPSYKGIDSSWRPYSIISFKSRYFSKVTPANTITMGIRDLTYEFCGRTQFSL